ncbi:MAG: phosphoribosyltransferase [Fibrobacter sp.]|nr:phosphoribosyltransferase [Fibrobacter sp.]
MFNPAEYSVLKNKDNVYLAMPSSSNLFPLALANLLKENFGGIVIDGFAKQLHGSGIKKLSGTDKIFAERSFQITEEFKKSIDSIQSKNIIIVDDIISTGFTLDAIRKLLHDFNINCNYVATIVNTSPSLTTENSIYSLAQKITTSPEEKIDYFKRMKSIFYNTPSAAMMHAHQCLRTPEDTERFKQKVDEKFNSYAIEGIQEYSYQIKHLKDICFSIYSNHNIQFPPTLTNLIEKFFTKNIDTGFITDTINRSISKHRNLNYAWSSNHLPDNFVKLYSCKNQDTSMYYIKSYKDQFAACQIHNKAHILLGTGKSVEYLERKIEHHSLLVQIKSDLQNSLKKDHNFQQSLDL